ncbi:TPA: hypothetical protein ACNE6D_001051 [Escherichia coli]
MIWQPEFTDKTLSRKPGAVHIDRFDIVFFSLKKFTDNRFVKTSRRYPMPMSEIFGVFPFKTALS